MEKTGITTEEKSQNELSRRQMIQKLTALSLLSAGGSFLAGKASAEVLTIPSHQHELKKVLIERLVNTHYHQDENGTITVLMNDEIWPGDEGGAYHQDWLFNPDYGLKTNARAALEDTIETDINHKGIPQGCDLDCVDTLIDSAEQMGLLDDLNLVYHVLREKIHVETHGAHERGVEMYLDWAMASDSLSLEEKQIVGKNVKKFMALPRPQGDHEYY